jgi:6-pyruvoyltetrahydropterin/6-carboxytetrahydropterin synthase
MPGYRMVLAKEDFKFSSAHFTLFPDDRTELLHGHNYRVRVEVAGPEVDGDGLLVDIERLKRAIRALCCALDSRTLIPGASERLRWRAEGEDGVEREGVEVRFEERVYRFPARDVLVLPLANTTIELLAKKFWLDLQPALEGQAVDSLAVSVEESAGQQCWYEARISGL